MHAQSLSCVLFFATWTSPPGSFVRGISQERILEWLAISSCKGSSRPRDWTQVSCVSFTGRRILYPCTAWEAQINVVYLESRMRYSSENESTTAWIGTIKQCQRQNILSWRILFWFKSKQLSWLLLIFNIYVSFSLEYEMATYSSVLDWEVLWGCKESDTTEYPYTHTSSKLSHFITCFLRNIIKGCFMYSTWKLTQIIKCPPLLITICRSGNSELL